MLLLTGVAGGCRNVGDTQAIQAFFEMLGFIHIYIADASSASISWLQVLLRRLCALATAHMCGFSKAKRKGILSNGWNLLEHVKTCIRCKPTDPAYSLDMFKPTLVFLLLPKTPTKKST